MSEPCFIRRIVTKTAASNGIVERSCCGYSGASVNRKSKRTILLAIGLAAGSGLLWLLLRGDIAVLDPQGEIADKERNLIIFASLLSLLVVIPVFVMTFVIAWRYREGNHRARYTPDWDHSRLAESIWWGIPLALILVLSVVTWKSSHDLDPFKPLSSTTKPLNVQVIALQYKWLFIYPEQHIASVNWLQLPEDTPINFSITADAPMNSFWIPKLGGQIYAMNGMSTKLHLMADAPGDYEGSSANISGEGFADMHFTARVTAGNDFREWINQMKQAPEQLNLEAYLKLAEPSTPRQPQAYSWSEAGLYDWVVTRYSTPENQEIAR